MGRGFPYQAIRSSKGAIDKVGEVCGVVHRGEQTGTDVKLPHAFPVQTFLFCFKNQFILQFCTSALRAFLHTPGPRKVIQPSVHSQTESKSWFLNNFHRTVFLHQSNLSTAKYMHSHREIPKVGMLSASDGRLFISPSLWLLPRTPTLEQRRQNHAFRDFLCKSWIKSWLKSRGRPRRRWACKAWRGKAQWGYCCGVRTHQKARRGHCGNNDKTEQETKAPIVLLSIESAGQEVQMTQLC